MATMQGAFELSICINLARHRAIEWKSPSSIRCADLKASLCDIDRQDMEVGHGLLF
jgi:hypothetical protein